MADPTIPLSIYLLRTERVASFEASLPIDAAQQSLAPPLDGYAVPLPSGIRPPEWVPVVQSILQDPGAFSLAGQSPAAFVVIREGGRTFILSFGHAWSRLDDDWLEPDFGRR